MAFSENLANENYVLLEFKIYFAISFIFETILKFSVKLNLLNCVHCEYILQFYYSFFGYGDPMAYKSVELVKLYQHMRHPGTIMLMLILWIHPIMTVSRMVLAIGFTLYLTLGFSVTFADYEYAKQQWDKKLL